jgi:hypothetical protein
LVFFIVNSKKKNNNYEKLKLKTAYWA